MDSEPQGPVISSEKAVDIAVDPDVIALMTEPSPMGTLTVLVCCGFMYMKVKPGTGEKTTLIRKRYHEKTKTWEVWDPARFPVAERRSVVRIMSRTGYKSMDIATIFGVSISTVTADIR